MGLLGGFGKFGGINLLAKALKKKKKPAPVDDPPLSFSPKPTTITTGPMPERPQDMLKNRPDLQPGFSEGFKRRARDINEDIEERRKRRRREQGI